MISHLVRASVLALACFATAAESAPTRKSPPRNAPERPAPAANLYDGSWTVLIVTERGTCDRAYRYGVEIVDGTVRYNGAVAFTGHVARNGNVEVSVSAGSNRANGTGRLTHTNGQGKWVGYSGSDLCSGYWQAERR
jgi:hypothetical protein